MVESEYEEIPCAATNPAVIRNVLKLTAITSPIFVYPISFPIVSESTVKEEI